MSSKVIFKKWESPIGDLFLYSRESNLIALTFPANRDGVVKRLRIGDAEEGGTPVIKETVRQLEEYFNGSRKEFGVELTTSGTEFQVKAWDELRRISFGNVLSYKEQAQRIGSEKAIRAVGSANGRNPISILIPCHRVLGSDGRISGYAGGSDIKAKLLELEGVRYR